MSDKSHLEQLMPRAVEAEKSVLGAAMRDRTIVPELSLILRVSDFNTFAHQLVWKAILALDEKNEPTEPAAVADVLEGRKHVEEIGGYGYLIDLWNNAISSAAAPYYAGIVKDKAIRRELILATNEIMKEAYLPGDDAATIVQDAERRIYEISQRKYNAGGIVPMVAALSQGLEALDRRSGRCDGGEVEGAIQTGWRELDDVIVGFHKGELIVVAARPSVGKTLVAVNVVNHIAETGKKVFFASLEQRNEELIHRMLSRYGRVDSKQIRSGAIDDLGAARILEAADKIREQRVFFDDAGSQSAARIVSNARHLHAKEGLDLLVIDYLQIMESENPNDLITLQIGRNTRRLKQLAKELQIPVIVLSQLNRGSEHRQDKEPVLSDLRLSGEIEQDADTVLLLHKPEPPDEYRKQDILVVKVGKQRNGPLGRVELLHNKPFMEITDYSPAPDFPRAFDGNGKSGRDYAANN